MLSAVEHLDFCIFLCALLRVSILLKGATSSIGL